MAVPLDCGLWIVDTVLGSAVRGVVLKVQWLQSTMYVYVYILFSLRAPRRAPRRTRVSHAWLLRYLTARAAAGAGAWQLSSCSCSRPRSRSSTSRTDERLMRLTCVQDGCKPASRQKSSASDRWAANYLLVRVLAQIVQLQWPPVSAVVAVRLVVVAHVRRTTLGKRPDLRRSARADAGAGTAMGRQGERGPRGRGRNDGSVGRWATAGLRRVTHSG